MTRDEIDAKHEGKTFLCAGPLRLARPHRNKATLRFDDALAEQVPTARYAALATLVLALEDYLRVYEGGSLTNADGARVRAFIPIEDAYPGSAEATADPTALILNPEIPLSGLIEMATTLIRARTPCGAILEIHALPYDGRDHGIKCAACGTVHIVNRPIPDEDRHAALDKARARMEAALGL